MTQHFDYCPSASEGDNQSVGSSAPVVSRCFPGGYNVKLYISRGMVSMVVTGFFAQWLYAETQISYIHNDVISPRLISLLWFLLPFGLLKSFDFFKEIYSP